MFFHKKVVIFYFLMLIAFVGCTADNDSTTTATSVSVSTPTQTFSADASTAIAEQTTSPDDLETTTIPTTTQQDVSKLPSNLPITIAYLVDGSISFECLDQDICFPDVNIRQIGMDNTYTLGSIYYVTPSRFLVVLNLDDLAAIVQINPETREISQINLPIETDARIRTIAHGKLVLAQASRVMIIQDDGSVIDTPVEKKVFQLIETADNKVIAITDQPIEMTGDTFINVFVIDVDTGESVEKLIQVPNFEPNAMPTSGIPQGNEPYAGRLFTVGSDLLNTYLYYAYMDGNDVKKELGMFDADSLKTVATYTDPQFIDTLSGYSQQYKNIAYSRITDTDGGGIDTLIRLSDLNPLIDVSQIVRQEYRKYLLFAPFGEYFLVGTGSRVLCLTLDGEVIGEFALPVDDIKDYYRLVEYRQIKK